MRDKMSGAVYLICILVLVFESEACPDGWIDAIPYNLGCLNFPTEFALSKDEAVHTCNLLGTGADSDGAASPGDALVQLVEPSDATQASTLAQIAAFVQKDRNNWWIGLSYYVAVTGFAWDSIPGAAVDPAATFPDIFTADDNPPLFDDDLCVVMTSDNSKPIWDDTPCFDDIYADGQIGQICQCMSGTCPVPAPTTPIPSTTPGPIVCHGDWEPVDSIGCVQVMVDAPGQSYEEAQATCSGIGGYLVELETEDQITNFNAKLKFYNTVYPDLETFWVGMELYFGAVWVLPNSNVAMDNAIIPWYDGTSGSVPGTAQPDGPTGGGEDCVVATWSTAEGPGWHDVTCDSTTFLEKEIIPVCMEDPDATGTSTNPAQSSQKSTVVTMKH